MIEAIGQLLLVLLALAVVVAMILGAAWAARRYGALGLLGSGTRMRTVAVSSVGQRERVVLMEVHGVRLLLGVSAGGVSMLREFPPGSFPEDEGEANAAGLPTPRPGEPMRFKDAFAVALRRALGQNVE